MKRTNAGFTIVELMIATTVLAVILLLSTVVITRIGNLYFKGVNQSRVQSNARDIAGQLTQDIQLSSTPPSYNPSVLVGGKPAKVICVGSVRYTFIDNVKIGTNGYKHVLWRDAPGTCATNVGADLTTALSDGDELVGGNTLITKFDFPSMANGMQPITINIAYIGGETVPGNALNSTNPATCKGGAGTQYCATANLSTVVVQRL